MSAVASVEVSSPTGEAVGHEAEAHEWSALAEAAEQRRWLTWFGLPAGVAALFVGVSIGTGRMWWLGVSILAIIIDIGVLIWLALSSDTNRQPVGAPARH